MELHPRMYW